MPRKMYSFLTSLVFFSALMTILGPEGNFGMIRCPSRQPKTEEHTPDGKHGEDVAPGNVNTAESPNRRRA